VYCLAKILLDKFHSVLNAATHLVIKLRKFDHERRRF